MIARPALVAAAFLAAATLVGCAVNKTFDLNVATEVGTAPATLDALKCAVQQAGWNITYADKDSISGRKTVGLDNVPLTLNLRIRADNPTQVVMTTHNPRGIIGLKVYQRPIIAALRKCGSPNVRWTQVE